MRLPELRDRLDEECTFPLETDRAAVLLENVRLDPPNGEPVELSTVLERDEETTYRSSRELHDSVLANLDERHVGRKHYDDRSRTPAREYELSF
ncbi:hypothetical protein ACFQE8_16560 [Salinirubellus sp. GCM10025818]|jgi:hypothetical protein|uniref:DUF5789 family protein n=1 Tax=Salinirubellus TaxID=2162630 RepID=UPI0030D1BAC4